MLNDVSMPKKLCVLLLICCTTTSFAKEELYSAKRSIREGNYAEAYCLLKPMAKKGHPEAQYQIGWMYHNGYGLAVDDAKAAYWWEKAAGHNTLDAMTALVMLYREGGIGIKKDLPKAAKYLLKAAQSGDEEARMLLSYFLEDADWALQSQIKKVLDSNPESLGPVMFVNVDKANMRKSPSTNSAVIETAKNGEKLIFLARRNDWAHVVHVRKKQLAWVKGDLIGTSPPGRN